MGQINDDLMYEIELAMGVVLSQDEKDRLSVILMDLCNNHYQDGYDAALKDSESRQLELTSLTTEELNVKEAYNLLCALQDSGEGW